MVNGIDVLLVGISWLVWHCGLRPRPARYPGPRASLRRLVSDIMAGYSIAESEADVPHRDERWDDDEREYEDDEEAEDE